MHALPVDVDPHQVDEDDDDEQDEPTVDAGEDSPVEVYEGDDDDE